MSKVTEGGAESSVGDPSRPFSVYFSVLVREFEDMCGEGPEQW